MISRLLYLMIIGVLVFTFDGLGQNSWVKTYGEGGGKLILNHIDNGIIYLSRNITDNTINTVILSVDKYGNIIWKKEFLNCDGKSLCKSNDGGYVIIGSTNCNYGGFFKGEHHGEIGNDIFLVKLDKSGNTLWKKIYGGSDDDKGLHMVDIGKGGYILIGEFSSNNGDFANYKIGTRDYEDLIIIWVDSLGNIQNMNSYGGDGRDFLQSCSHSEKKEIFLTGFTTSNNGLFYNVLKNGSDTCLRFVLKLDLNGNILWNSIFQYVYNMEDSISIISTNDKGCLLLINTIPESIIFSDELRSNSLKKGYGSDDIFLIKYDSSGNKLWEKVYGGGRQERFNSITELNNNMFLLSCLSNSYDGDIYRERKYSYGNTDLWKNILFIIDKNGILRKTQIYDYEGSGEVKYECFNDNCYRYGMKRGHIYLEKLSLDNIK